MKYTIIIKGTTQNEYCSIEKLMVTKRMVCINYTDISKSSLFNLPRARKLIKFAILRYSRTNEDIKDRVLSNYLNIIGRTNFVKNSPTISIERIK